MISRCSGCKHIAKLLQAYCKPALCGLKRSMLVVTRSTVWIAWIAWPWRQWGTWGDVVNDRPARALSHGRDHKSFDSFEFYCAYSWRWGFWKLLGCRSLMACPASFGVTLVLLFCSRFQFFCCLPALIPVCFGCIQKLEHHQIDVNYYVCWCWVSQYVDFCKFEWVSLH